MAPKTSSSKYGHFIIGTFTSQSDQSLTSSPSLSLSLEPLSLSNSGNKTNPRPFDVYKKKRYAELKAQRPNDDVNERMRIISAEWKALKEQQEQQNK
ncbi:hypothetical protein JCM3765_004571 [Sporobolomyces pararoseus]